MFEKEIIDLIADIPESDLLSSYAGRPSIFSDSAPEDVAFPYIVVSIDELSPPGFVISRFQLDIGVFDYGTSHKNVRSIIFSIQNILDCQRISSVKYNDIRIRRESMYHIDVPDPRGIHYLLRFEARGSRFYWTKTI
jgi:hypothetical protein